MKAVLIVAGGGALGAATRYLVYVAAGHILGTGFPFGTLIVNVSGSFAMGALTEIMALVWSAPSQARLLLMVGFLGAFTTFSTFSLDVVTLYDRGRFLLCAVYVASSVVLSVAALFAGLMLFRRLLAPFV